MQDAGAHTERQLGLDWLRIGAFGLLILYHIGMYFGPWDWHVKTEEPITWVQWPMIAVNPWRLTLLFLISGIVSRSLMAKLFTPSEFAISRSGRLLVPLLAGMAIFVVPQPWIELRDRGTYSDGLFHFWLNDYAEFGSSRGTPLPTWNHLWFVAYVWAYSMVLAGAALLPNDWRAKAQQCFDGIFSGPYLLLLPLLWLFLARAVLLPAFGETHALVDDPYAHAVYGFAFFFGVGLGGSHPTWTAIIQNWKLSLSVALIGCVLTIGIPILTTESQPLALARSAARALLAWGAILGLLGMARIYLNYDGPVRRYLTEAIFPYYIAHQTIIIVAGYYLKQLSIGPSLEFLGVFLSTVGGCVLTYELGRRITWIRPFLGLKTARAKRHPRVPMAVVTGA